VFDLIEDSRTRMNMNDHPNKRLVIKKKVVGGKEKEKKKKEKEQRQTGNQKGMKERMKRIHQFPS
jgi:hypothetical protein